MDINYLEKLIYPYNLLLVKYLKSNSTKTEFILENGLIVIGGYTLRKFEKLLETNPYFKRVHLSYLINFKFILSIEEKSGFLKLKDGVVIPIGNTYKSNIPERNISEN